MNNQIEEVNRTNKDDVLLKFWLTRKQAVKFNKARDLISEELGKPVSEAEAILYVFEHAFEEDFEKTNSPLEDEIYKRFGIEDASESPENLAQYEDFIFEMFQVHTIGSKHVKLMHLFEDEIFSPVVFDKELHSLLKLNQVFLMKLGFKNRKWHVIYMSPPYV